MKSKNILIVGSGSVGQRHARNFSSLDCDIFCVDPRIDRCEQLSKTTPTIKTFTNLRDAFSAGISYDGAVISSPTKYHTDQSILCIKQKIPILLEKPVSKDYQSACNLLTVLKGSNVPLLLGYTWRWWEPLRKVKSLLNEKTVGKLLHARFVMSAHLADWHPWEPYQEFFMASKDLGGGALLDESHWLDMMVWMFGTPQKVFASIGKTSDLEIQTDDNVDMLFEYKNSLRISMHLDLYGRPHEKSITFCGENGTIVWSADPNEIRICSTMEPNWKSLLFDCQRNEMFVNVAKEFMEIIEGRSHYTCGLEEGVNIMKIIDAARQSSKREKQINIESIL